MTRLVTTITETRSAVGDLRKAGARVALVPTMGALHAGHLALVARARDLADAVVVSVFVNPLQFGPTEDFERYPRTLDDDRRALEAAGVDLLFAPTVAEMYPDGTAQVSIDPGPLGEQFEGAVRPGHFGGVLTVVAKLLNIVGPDVAVFGQKDAQQVFLVQRMAHDLNLPVAIEAAPIVREADGLALSSRNRYLDEEHRARAAAMPAALEAARSAAAGGVESAVAAARAALESRRDAHIDYVAAVDPATFRPVDDRYRGPALVLLAARFGGTRLIDNGIVHLG